MTLVAETSGEPGGPCCVLIASKDGAAHIGTAVTAAAAQCPVFVVSDGSTDATAATARAAGATVLDLDQNVGKPAALRRAIDHFGLLGRFAAVAVVDDDTILEPGFVRACLERMTDGVAIVVGHTRSDWGGATTWNPWVAARAFAYWRYQLVTRRVQSALGVMNCIAGSNSVIRSSVLGAVLRDDTPYIVDDTFWTLEVHRRRLGRIVYAPAGVATIQDPTTLGAWYRQNHRWLWGTLQGVIGHRVGRRASAFDLAYLGLIAEWVLYVAVWPVLLVAVARSSPAGWATVALAYFGGYLAWALVGAVALRRWQLVPMFWALIVSDWAQRVNFVHAAASAWRRPRVASCRWVSPPRLGAAAPAPAGDRNALRAPASGAA